MLKNFISKLIIKMSSLKTILQVIKFDLIVNISKINELES